MISEIHVFSTNSTPEYHFCQDGMLKIRGKALYKNRTQEVEQILNWVSEYLKDPAEITYVVLAFEYLNSMSTVILVSILRNLTEVILQSKKLVIQWYYEDDDEDMFERGEYISFTFDIPIIFIPTNARITN